MSYLVLARKWRPQSFDEVVGQVHVTKTLVNAIEMDRVAHAFLFSGVRGVGKTSLARILAKALKQETLFIPGQVMENHSIGLYISNKKNQLPILRRKAKRK